MNITLDDTSPSLNYSPQWRRQPVADDHYFLDTYRASQTKGDTMTLTFDGSAIYIYGSRGPNHGNYSVQFDDFVQYFPGFSNDVKYQYLLFSRTFTPGPHSIVLTNQDYFWLDVDFVAITVASTVNTTARDPGAFSSTVSPATSPTVDPSGSSNGTLQSNSPTATASSSPMFFILTIVLASALGILLFLLIAFCWWKRRRDFEYARELSFRYGHNGKPTAPKFSHEGSASAARPTTFGNALLGILPGSWRGPSTASGRSVPTSARHQERNQGSNIAEGSAETRGEDDSMIALSNFGERPRFPGEHGRKAHAGESARSDSGSGTITEHSEARSWRTGGTANLGMSSASVLSWGYSKTENEVSKAPGSPTVATSIVSDGQLSQWTAKPGHRSNLGAPIMSSSSDMPMSISSTSSLTATQLITQRQRQEGRSFSPAQSDVTGYSASEAAAYASRHKVNRSGGSGGYAHLITSAGASTGGGGGGGAGAGAGGGPQPLKPPPRTERDRERERLEKIEREERERQERLASARYDLVGAAKDRSRPPPPYSSSATPRPSQSSSRTGDVAHAPGAGMGIPASNFDRDLEVARSGSPSNISARSKYSARGTVGTGSGREYTITPDLSVPQPGNRSYTPDDR